MRSACALVGFVLALASARAGAQALEMRRAGEIAMRGCEALRVPELRGALDAELRGLEVADGAPLDVAIECAGEVAVVLSVRGSPRPPRVLDVSDVPPRLRTRLIAMAMAELLRVEAMLEADAAVESAAIEPGAEPEPAAAARARPELEPELAREPEAAPDSRPDSDARADPPSLDRPPARRRRSRGALTRIALDDISTAAPSIAPIVRAGLRLFPQRVLVLGGGDALVRFGTVALGIHASAAPERTDELGSLLPRLVLGIAEASLVCLDHALVEICGGVHLGAGRADVDAKAARDDVTARSLEGSFVEAAVTISAAVVVDVIALGVDVSAGWSEGLIALADGREVLALAGPVIALSLALEVLP